MRFRLIAVLTLLLPALAAANLPQVRIVVPETVTASSRDGLRVVPEIELVNNGGTPLTYRVCGDASRPIWAGRIAFELIVASCNTAAPLYFAPSDIFSARKVVLGIGTTVNLRYGQTVRARLAPGSYTLKGTAVMEDERGERHKVQCIPATFVVTAESDTPLPPKPTGTGTANAH